MKMRTQIALLAIALIAAEALALLPRTLSQTHEDVEKVMVEEATIVTDYCPTLEGIRKVADIYTTTDISVDVDQLYDPLEDLRLRTGCAFGVVRYSARHFEEFMRIRLPEPDANIEFVIVRATVTEGGYREVYALIDEVVEQEVATETKTDLEPAARKASLGSVAGFK